MEPKNIMIHVVKWSAVGIGALLLFVVLLFSLIQTGTVKEKIAQILSDRLSTSPDTQVKITDIDGLLPIDIRVGSVKVGDAEGEWLTAEGLQLRWSPISVLAKSFVVNEITADTIHLDRLPKTPPKKEEEKPGEPFSLPTSLPSVLLEKLDVQQLILEKPVLGEKALFTIHGKVSPSESSPGLSAFLDIQRTDASLPQAALTAAIEGIPPLLALHAEVNDSANGLLSSIMGLKDAGPLSLKLDGKGPLEGWNGQLTASAGTYGNLNAKLGLAVSDNATKLTADGDLDVASSLLPPKTAPLVGEKSHFKLAVQVNPSNVIVLDQLDIQTQNPALQISGSFDPKKQTLKSDFVLKVDNVSSLKELAGTDLSGRLKIEGAVAGSIQNPEGTVSVELGEIQVQSFQSKHMDFQIAFNPLHPKSSTFQGVRIAGKGSAEGLVYPEAQTLQENRLTWVLEAGVPSRGEIGISKFEIKGEQLALSVKGNFNPEGPTGKLDSSLEIRDLRRLSSFLKDNTLAGSLNIQVHAEKGAQTDFVSAQIEGRTKNLKGLPPPVMALLGPETHVTGGFRLEEQKRSVVPRKEQTSAPPAATWARLVVRQLVVKGAAAHLSAEASADLLKKELAGSWQLSLPRLEVLSSSLQKKLGGSIEMDGKVSGPFSAPVLTIDSRGKNLSMDGTRLDRLTLNLDVREIPKSPKGRLEFGVTQAKQELALKTDFSLKGRLLGLSGMEIKAPATQAEGDLNVNLDTRLTEGQLRAKSSDLSPLGRFVGQKLGGSLTVDARLKPVNGNQTAKLDLKGSNLAAAAAQIKEVKVNADLKDLLKAPQGTADIQLKGLQSGELTVDSLSLTATGDAKKMVFKGKTNGRTVEEFSLDTGGSFTISPGGETVKLERLQGKFGEYPITLSQPTEFQRSAGSYTLTGLALGFGPGRIEASGKLKPGSVDLNATLKNLPLDLARYAGVSDLSGSVGGNLRMTGRPDRPEAAAQIDLSKVRVLSPELKNVPPSSIQIRAELSGNRKLNADLSLEGPVKKPLKATMNLPVEFSLEPFAFSVPSQGNIEGSLDAQVDLARLTSFFPLDQQSVTGQFNANLDIQGTLASPRVTGQANLEKGSYENLSTGTILKKINAKITAQGTELNIKELSATDGGKGTLSGRGKIDLDAEKNFPLDAEITLRNAELVRRPEVNASTDGRLTFSGSLKEAKLQGKLSVSPAEIQIPDRLAPDVPTMEVIEINHPEGKKQASSKAGKQSGKKKAEGSSAPMEMALNIDVNFPNRVYVRGRGLDSEWAGRLHVAGQASSPVVTGKLSVVRGSLDFLDKTFNLAQSSIGFYGAQPPSPDLDVTAESKTKDVTARLHFTGPASSPNLALESDPPLPKDEILARLLFGRSVDKITPMQAVRLANALRSLSGKGGNTFDVLGRMRSLLKVDQLNVEESEEGTTTLGVGKYLTEGVYVDVEKNVGAEGGTASVEVDITPNISVESKVGTDSQAGIGVNWKFDY